MTDDQPRTMALQGFANRVVRGMLRTPGLSSAVGRRLLTLYVVGRKSGKHYAIPVAYQPHGDVLLVGSPFAWGRNLRTGEPVDVRHLGKRRTADVEVRSDEAGVVEDYAVIARDNANFARFNKISTAPDGTPDPADLHRAWTNGARVYRLRLR